jgi:hypothetical protein
MAGYSGTPLARKLGIKEGHRVLLIGTPADVALEPLPPGAVVHRRASAAPYDVILACCGDRASLARGFARWRGLLAEAGGLWLGWPKKSSGVPTDLTEHLVRDRGLREGLVDNKVCAVDETWSALRFVVRAADRDTGIR